MEPDKTTIINPQIQIVEGDPCALAEIALTHRLYVEVGQLHNILQNIINQVYDEAFICLLEADHIPVGVCTIADNAVQAFVAPIQRNRGYGEALVHHTIALSGKDNCELQADFGLDTDQSKRFWNKCEVFCGSIGLNQHHLNLIETLGVDAVVAQIKHEAIEHMKTSKKITLKM